jgi:Ni/Fe-hydrogenase subunit HybB-like protein
MSHHETAHSAVGGELFTPAYKKILLVVGLGAAAAIARFTLGIGAVSNLNDGYPWGIWIALDVVTGTALGCGGYAVAILVYILNKGEYHPLVRPAILTSLLGYGLAVLAVTIDLGRYWDLWKVPVFFWRWTHSPQLEVALCVATYVMVLIVELSPAAFEKWQAEPASRWRGLAATGQKVMDKALVWVLALGMLLPTMHQSSLGTMMLLPASKLHPLWWTPWLPLLFLVNCILMGYAAVVLESHISARAFNRTAETAMLAKLTRVAWGVAIAWLVFRVGDIAIRGAFATIVSGYGLAFLVETALLLGAIGILSSESNRRSPAHQFRAAMLLVLGGTAFRLNTYLVAFRPGSQWSYFPAVPELLITLGIIALEVALYVAAVKKFPILSGDAKVAAATR